MTTYNTYQEAKITMPKACICVYKNNGEDVFIGMPSREGTTTFNGADFAEPQDYCMTVEKFLADGYRFVEGDFIIQHDGMVVRVCDDPDWNMKERRDNIRYILLAAALENIPTEAPEEKEVLDSIESAGEVEWKSGDLLEFMGEPCVFVSMLNGFPVVKYTEDADRSLAGCFDEIIAVDRLKKPETPQQREERERLEAAYDLFVCAADDGVAVNPNLKDWKSKYPSVVKMWLRVVDKTNYRKEKIHGTN